jgi:hypothetical protein
MDENPGRHEQVFYLSGVKNFTFFALKVYFQFQSTASSFIIDIFHFPPNSTPVFNLKKK